MPPAEPASVPTVSEPQPTMPFEMQIFDRLGGRARRMRTLVVGVEERFGAGRCACTSRCAATPRLPGLDRAVLRLPGLDALDGEKIVGIGRGLLRAIDDIHRRDEILDRNGVGRAVGIVLAGDPVAGRVEMGAGVLAELQPVPRPIGAVGIVMRDLMHLDRRRVLDICGGSWMTGVSGPSGAVSRRPDRPGKQRRSQIGERSWLNSLVLPISLPDMSATLHAAFGLECSRGAERGPTA